VGAHKMTMKATLTAEFGTPRPDCNGGPIQSSCPSVGITVNDFAGATSMNASGRPGRAGRLFGFRQVSLRSPRGADRSDFLTGALKPLSATSDSGGNVVIHIIGASKNLRGTATVTSTQPASTDLCKKVSSSSSFGSSWVNGAKPLTVRGEIESAFSVKNNSDASFEVTKTATPA
jgi:hypothetical protein